MIPRLRPPFGFTELLRATFSKDSAAIERFEQRFAERFGFPHGLFFPYGRSALHALLSGMGWQDREIVVPAYTCVVVPHAVTLSGNRARFVDSGNDHFNVTPESLAAGIGPDTAMTVLTPIFGYELDRRGCEKEIRTRAPNSMILYDLAHGFGVEDRQGRLSDNGDAALFGLGASKYISSLYGGMILLRDQAIWEQVRSYRDRMYATAGLSLSVARFIYGLSIWAAFREPALSLVHFLEHKTALLHRFTEDMYGKRGPSLPDDFQVMPTTMQARLGLRQLDRYDDIEAARWATSHRYEYLLRAEGFPVFDSGQGTTFSQFPMPVADRGAVVRASLARGVQLGIIVDYCCPSLPGYEAAPGAFPNACWYGDHMVNLPNWPGLGPKGVQKVVDVLCRVRESNPTAFVVDTSVPKVGV